MATDLKVYGPFEIEFAKNARLKQVTVSHVSAFWLKPDVTKLKLKQKQGSYVFGLQAAKGFKPWYVGRASRGFGQETFNKSNLNRYNGVLFKGNKGTPVLFFVAPLDNKTKVPAAELNHMEKELIQFAVNRNPDICNVQNTKNLPQWTIKGVIRSTPGRPDAAAKKFKKMMRIR